MELSMTELNVVSGISFDRCSIDFAYRDIAMKENHFRSAPLAFSESNESRAFRDKRQRCALHGLEIFLFSKRTRQLRAYRSHYSSTRSGEQFLSGIYDRTLVPRIAHLGAAS